MGTTRGVYVVEEDGMDKQSRARELENRIERTKQIAITLTKLNELKKELRKWRLVTALTSFLVFCVMLVQMSVDLQEIFKAEGIWFHLLVEVTFPCMCVFGLLAMLVYRYILRKRKKILERKLTEIV